MKVKTSKLEGKALDWAVAQLDPMCEGLEWRPTAEGQAWVGFGTVDGKPRPCAYLAHRACMAEKVRMIRDGVEPYAPSKNWAQGGPLIDRYLVAFHVTTVGGCAVRAWAARENGASLGLTHLVAAMRAIVRVELGDEVDVPAQLMVAA